MKLIKAVFIALPLFSGTCFADTNYELGSYGKGKDSFIASVLGGERLFIFRNGVRVVQVVTALKDINVDYRLRQEVWGISCTIPQMFLVYRKSEYPNDTSKEPFVREFPLAVAEFPIKGKLSGDVIDVVCAMPLTRFNKID